QPDGTLVVAGNAIDEFAALVGYAADGTVDATFGSGGRVLTPFAGAGRVRTLLTIPGHKLVVVGAGGAESFAALARYAQSAAPGAPGVPTTSTAGIVGASTAPIGCPGGTSPAAVQCRADLLAAAIQSGVAESTLREALLSMVNDTRLALGARG